MKCEKVNHGILLDGHHLLGWDAAEELRVNLNFYLGHPGEIARQNGEGQANSNQQLKVEIAALIPAVEACSGYARNGEAIRSVVAKMRQLSAV